jgi:hypothetical protein
VPVAVNVPNTISALDLATISIAGGMLASIVVLAATVVLAVGAVRFGWDPTTSTALGWSSPP